MVVRGEGDYGDVICATRTPFRQQGWAGKKTAHPRAHERIETSIYAPPSMKRVVSSDEPSPL